jgi:hypothetical protein
VFDLHDGMFDRHVVSRSPNSQSEIAQKWTLSFRFSEHAILAVKMLLRVRAKFIGPAREALFYLEHPEKETHATRDVPHTCNKRRIRFFIQATG